MNLWVQDLKFRLHNFNKLVIMCIGNRNASDDGAGLKLADELSTILEEKKSSKVSVIRCYESPENFTSPVKKMKPSHILIIDSCVSGKKPGTISVFDKEDLREYDIISHRIPIALLSEYLASETGAKIIVLGIEPECIAKGTNISKPVKEAIKGIAHFFYEFIKGSNKV
ncbi:MAG: hydrogenase 3 maturation endopeptidase HyCI [Candidatus Omnitrophica bacterium]|nr:hydrogenase 3 maturation endopeptidase HyCI [Candidatus Omnitrophota bacterium]